MNISYVVLYSVITSTLSIMLNQYLSSCLQSFPPIVHHFTCNWPFEHCYQRRIWYANDQSNQPVVLYSGRGAFWPKTLMKTANYCIKIIQSANVLSVSGMYKSEEHYYNQQNFHKIERFWTKWIFFSPWNSLFKPSTHFKLLFFRV